MGRIGVVNYDAGNLQSVETALQHLGADFIVSSDPKVLDAADKLIFPGVGEARAAMDRLEHYGLDDFISQYHREGRYILGICIGAQIILTRSEENDTGCLNLVEGTARKFPAVKGLKVPHMGWNTVHVKGETDLFRGIPDGSSFYFVHSYYPSPENEEQTLAYTCYGIDFCSALRKGSLYAVQFHPEKSGKWGLQLLSNYITGIGPDCTSAGEA